MNTNPTLAITAPLSATTQKTSAIVTATTAYSTTPQRIDEFIKHKLSVVNSDEGCGIIDSGQRAVRLGFGSSANARYSAYLAAFQSSPHLTRMYADIYPNCVFLPWSALHLVMKTMKLWMDLPKHYLGAVPSEQLPWMEIFELERRHEVDTREIHDIIPNAWEEARTRMHQVLSSYMADCSFRPSTAPLSAVAEAAEARARAHMARPAAAFWDEALESFFVIAPPEAFNTEEDWLTRLEKLARQTRPVVKTPPNDPLVVRMCHGGVLVVASWGDEGAELNEITARLGL